MCASVFVCACVKEKHSVSNDKILCPVDVDAILACLHTIPSSTFIADVRLHSIRMALLCIASLLSHVLVAKQQARRQMHQKHKKNAMQKPPVTFHRRFISLPCWEQLFVKDGELQRQQKCKRQAKTRSAQVHFHMHVVVSYTTLCHFFSLWIAFFIPRMFPVLLVQSPSQSTELLHKFSCIIAWAVAAAKHFSIFALARPFVLMAILFSSSFHLPRRRFLWLFETCDKLIWQATQRTLKQL